jgi:riboflavin biosynthesis pyrimidine reductase
MEIVLHGEEAALLLTVSPEPKEKQPAQILVDSRHNLPLTNTLFVSSPAPTRAMIVVV